MPSHPPETKLYEDGTVAALWRDISRLFEDFCGSDRNQWPQKQKQFEIVLGDIQVRLKDAGGTFDSVPKMML